MTGLLRDARYAFRALRSSPLLTLAAVASLGLGIGATAAVFSAVDVFVIRPLEYPDADRIVTVWTTDAEQGWTRYSTSVPDYLEWRGASHTVELAAYTPAGVNLSGGDRPERLQGLRVASAFFDVLGAQPVLGRTFRPDEERSGADGVVILSHPVWRDRFAADPGVVGSVVRLDGRPYQVVGVMPESFAFSSLRDDFWVPLGTTGAESRAHRFLQVVGRLAPGVTVASARRELHAVQDRLAAAYPATNAGTGVFVERLQETWFGEGFQRGSLISAAGVLMVLLIACANVANLLLVRGSARRRELALRTALGASRGRLVRQLLTESVLLALAGGVLGVGIAALGVRGMHTLFPPFLPPAVRDVTLSGRILAFTTVIALGVGLLTGLAPALRSAREDVRPGLEGGPGAGGGRLRATVVGAEFALATVLLVSALLVIQGFVGLRARPLGYGVDERLVVRITLPETSYPGDASVRTFQTQLLSRLRALPGVREAAGASLLPMQGNTNWSYRLKGEPTSQAGRNPVVATRIITAGYFDALGIPLLAGRLPGSADAPDGPHVMVVNRRMAERHWAVDSAVGNVVLMDGAEHEIVGVVADTRDYGPDTDPFAMAYVPAAQHPVRTLSLVLHTATPPAASADAVRETVRALDPDQPVYDVTTMATIAEQWVSGNMAMVKMLVVMGAIALLLSVLGAYGVMAYTVTRRTREIGVRMALGADAARVRRHVLRQGLRLTGLGLAVGLAIAAVTTRLLAFFLYGVSPWDPMTFAGVAATLLFTGLAASWLPAARAARVDPMRALRVE